jgi:hypothetical protein
MSQIWTNELKYFGFHIENLETKFFPEASQIETHLPSGPTALASAIALRVLGEGLLHNIICTCRRWTLIPRHPILNFTRLGTTFAEKGVR